SPVLVAGGAGGLGGNRATATALGPDHNLYVGFIKNGNVLRVANPNGSSPTVQTIGKTSDGRGVSAFAFVGNDLYLAQKRGVTEIANAAGCAPNCLTLATGIIDTAPAALASDGANVLYVADTPASNSTILRYTISTGCQDTYATLGTLPNGSTVAFQFATALALDAPGNLFIGDDPTNGRQVLAGHVWQIAAGSSPEVPCGSGGGGVTPPPGPALTSGTLYTSGITSPGGVVWMGTHLWVSDHAFGFCRLDPNASVPGTFLANQDTCNLAAVSPGQPSFDSANNVVYVPDNSSKSQGVWRLSFNPTTETVGSPVLVAGGAGGLGGNRATATALGPDHNLYVGFIKNGNVLRVANPGGSSPTVQTIGKTSDGRGVSAFALVGNDLYLAQRAAVTEIANAVGCASSCPTSATGITATAPTAITSDGSGTLYVADSPGAVSTILRYTVGTQTQEVYATTGSLPNGSTVAFQFATALALDAPGNLFIGDDPSDGTQVFKGHVWKAAKP
ncbi:MAG: hypothetical protein HY690_01725, partial [Chloroflexi bacterium]|nr:hypothetical protein [Chloroflexota bacterium]